MDKVKSSFLPLLVIFGLVFLMGCKDVLTYSRRVEFEKLVFNQLLPTNPEASDLLAFQIQMKGTHNIDSVSMYSCYHPYPSDLKPYQSEKMNASMAEESCGLWIKTNTAIYNECGLIHQILSPKGRLKKEFIYNNNQLIKTLEHVINPLSGEDQIKNYSEFSYNKNGFIQSIRTPRYVNKYSYSYNLDGSVKGVQEEYSADKTFITRFDVSFFSSDSASILTTYNHRAKQLLNYSRNSNGTLQTCPAITYDSNGNTSALFPHIPVVSLCDSIGNWTYSRVDNIISKQIIHYRK